jgi:outer membrane protein
MKKLAIVAILALSALSVNAQVKIKFGWVNSAELLDIMPDKKKAAATIDSMVKAEEAIIKILNDEYEKKAKMLSTTGTTMMPDQLRKAQEDLAKIEDAIYLQTQTSRDKVSTKEKDLINPILDKVALAIKDVGKENGYTYIFDISLGQVIVYPEGDNVLKLVKKKLGLPVMD